MDKVCITGYRVRACAGLTMPAVLTKWRETGVQFSVSTTAIGAYPIVKECYSPERYVITFLTIWPTQSLITERILKWLAPWCIGDKWPQSALSPALWRPTWIEMIFIKSLKKNTFHHCREWSRFVAPPADPHSSGEFKDGLSSFMLFGRSPWHTLRHCSWLAYRKWRTVRPLTCNSADPDLILVNGFK